MKFLQCLSAVAPLLATVTSRQFDIPAIDHAVQMALQQNPDHHAYTGKPKGSTVATNGTGAPIHGFHVNAAQAGGYW